MNSTSRRTTASVVSLTLSAAAGLLLATAGPADAATGCGGLSTDFAGPAIVAQHKSCIGWTGAQVTMSGTDQAAGSGGSGWSSCTYHVSLRDDTIGTTVEGFTYSCGSTWGTHNLPNYSPPNGGHSYHTYSWITGSWKGQSVLQAVANSPEFGAP